MYHHSCSVIDIWLSCRCHFVCRCDCADDGDHANGDDDVDCDGGDRGDGNPLQTCTALSKTVMMLFPTTPYTTPQGTNLRSNCLRARACIHTTCEALAAPQPPGVLHLRLLFGCGDTQLFHTDVNGQVLWWCSLSTRVMCSTQPPHSSS